MLSIRDTRPLPQSAVAVTFCVFVAANNMSILSGNCGQQGGVRGGRHVACHMMAVQNKLQLFRACFQAFPAPLLDFPSILHSPVTTAYNSPGQMPLSNLVVNKWQWLSVVVCFRVFEYVCAYIIFEFVPFCHLIIYIFCVESICKRQLFAKLRRIN